MPSATQVLLHQLIDYAGLFPPAALDMGAAVREYAGHRQSKDAWMLGRFVLPVARLAEFAGEADGLLPLQEESGWRIAALPGPDLAAAGKAIGEFNCRHAAAGSGRAVIDVVEFKATTPEAVAEAMRSMPAWLAAYVEVPLDAGMEAVLDAVKVGGARAKVRTGGVATEAFPSSDSLGRFLIACARRSLPFKATAGLHHPLRGAYRLTYDPDPPRGIMFGFLNVFLAAALARQEGNLQDVAALLEERDPGAFTVSATAIAWRGHTFDTDQLSALREDAVSFGSCSFREPVDELRGLSWL